LSLLFENVSKVELRIFQYHMKNQAPEKKKKKQKTKKQSNNNKNSSLI